MAALLVAVSLLPASLRAAEDLDLEGHRARLLAPLERTLAGELEPGARTEFEELREKLVSSGSLHELLLGSLRLLPGRGTPLRSTQQLEFLEQAIALSDVAWAGARAKAAYFPFVQDLHLAAFDLAITRSQFEKARDRISGLEQLIAEREKLCEDPAGDELLAMARLFLAKLNVDEALQADGLIDRAALELERAKTELARLRSSETYRDLARRVELEIRTNVLADSEDYSALIATIERELQSDEELREAASLWIRLATAHWWRAEQIDRSTPSFAEKVRFHKRRGDEAIERALSCASNDRRDAATARSLKALWLLLGGDLEEGSRALEDYQELFSEKPAVGDDLVRLVQLRARAERLAGESSDGTREALRDCYQNLVEEWRERPLRSGGRGLLHFELPRLLITEHLRATSQANGARAALAEYLALESSHSLLRSLEFSAVSVEELQASLDSRGVLIPLATLDYTLLFAIDADSVALHVLASGLAIERVRRPWLKALRDHPQLVDDPEARSRAIERGGRELGKLLFPRELESWLSQRSSLSIVAGGTLRYLPYEAVLLSNGRALGLVKPLSTSGSISLECRLAEVHARRKGEGVRRVDAKVFADPLFHPRFKLAPLPMSEAQGARLLAPYPSDRTEFSRGSEVTLESSLNCGEAVHAQWFTHGGRIASEERYAAIYLSPSPASSLGKVAAREFDRARTAEIVSISACSVGAGPRRPGDSGISDLGGAFFLAGATAVIAPVEQIGYAATVRMSEEIHRSLAAGRTAAEALFDARRALDRKTNWSDHYYHSLLHVRGNAHAPFFEGSGEPPSVRSSLPLAWLLVPALLVVLLLVRRRQVLSRR